MTLIEFNTIVKKELQHGNKRVAYLYKQDDFYIGNMCHTKEEALSECHKFCINNNLVDNSELSIIVYHEDTIDVLGTNEVMLSLNLISKEEYIESANKFND